MNEYEILLKNSNSKTYTTISWLVIALNFLALCYLAIVRSSEKLDYPFFTVALLGIVFITGMAMKKKIFTDVKIYFLIIIVAWIILWVYWAAIANILLFILQLITKKNKVVVLSENYIVYPSFPRKKILWQELNNLMLKDGLLTIDNKNNKIIQQEIDDKPEKINEKEFNEFCRVNLTKKSVDPDDYRYRAHWENA